MKIQFLLKIFDETLNKYLPSMLHKEKNFNKSEINLNFESFTAEINHDYRLELDIEIDGKFEPKHSYKTKLIGENVNH